MPSPFEHVTAGETAARRAIYGQGSGAFSQLRNPSPAGRRVLSLALRHGPRPVAASRWWSSVWGAARDRLSTALSTVAARSGRLAWLDAVAARIKPALTQEQAAALAVEAAQRSAAAAIEGLMTQQLTALDVGAWNLARAGLTSREAVAELALRLGPTERQLRRILAWQQRQELAGVPRAEILAGLRQRTHRASLLRARAIASDQAATTLNDARLKVFTEAGALIYSANMGDERVRDTHLEQTAATQAALTPAGEPWRGAPPFSGNPPYEILCRCWVEAAEEGPREPEDEALDVLLFDKGTSQEFRDATAAAWSAIPRQVRLRLREAGMRVRGGKSSIRQMLIDDELSLGDPGERYANVHGVSQWEPVRGLQATKVFVSEADGAERWRGILLHEAGHSVSWLDQGLIVGREADLHEAREAFRAAVRRDFNDLRSSPYHRTRMAQYHQDLSDRGFSEVFAEAFAHAVGRRGQTGLLIRRSGTDWWTTDGTSNFAAVFRHTMEYMDEWLEKFL